MPPIVDWRHVSAADFRVPADHRLSDLTAELTELLGTPDSELRELALDVICTWIERGVYDDLLPGLGDGIATGLMAGIGESGTDTVFRRSFSALVVAEVIDRDSRRPRVSRTKIHEWGDRLATWFLMERDERGWVDGHGWAHAIAHGADAFGALARSPHCGPGELLVVLDVIGDRVTRTPGNVWYSGEPDRLAMTTLHVLRRGLVPDELVEAWLQRIATAARPRRDESTKSDVYLRTGNAAAFLRALYLQLALGPAAPPRRSDLVLLLVEHLRRTHPAYLGPSQHRAGS
ncbi:hypothetical protein DJ010_00305 [Nocardioides silvaticus]|uniref:DUF2785 domain-containing protein n=1 Tax=Nocardioides silvaticus TaxID=2201891 RepID=A0A316TPI3_9ACTN|nr:DUF2785 domain-containing protein [Nocardioides silvaticus]PWN04142.1 hypothetical protein DJ010_00305 [Nocardioides silvaticus]